MVLKYIMEKSSESNPITNADIIEFLKCNKLNPCKKTMISIIKSIKDAGFDLITVKDKRTNMYYIPSEHFDTTEATLICLAFSTGLTVSQGNMILSALDLQTL